MLQFATFIPLLLILIYRNFCDNYFIFSQMTCTFCVIYRNLVLTEHNIYRIAVKPTWYIITYPSNVPSHTQVMYHHIHQVMYHPLLNVMVYCLVDVMGRQLVIKWYTITSPSDIPSHPQVIYHHLRNWYITTFTKWCTIIYSMWWYISWWMWWVVAWWM